MTWAYGVVGMVQLAAHWWSGPARCRRPNSSTSSPRSPTAGSATLLPAAADLTEDGR